MMPNYSDELSRQVVAAGKYSSPCAQLGSAGTGRAMSRWSVLLLPHRDSNRLLAAKPLSESCQPPNSIGGRTSGRTPPQVATAAKN
jgi:hypothetical protein